MTRPWLQLHTRDWLDSKELRRCSPAARGILADLMCLAHEGEPYGYLADKLGPLTIKYMASRCFVTTSQFTKAIAELLEHQRLEKPEGGPMFVGRMVDDERVRLSRTVGGYESRGNPKLGVAYNAPGFVYLLRRSSDGAVKIGIATDVQNRIYKLKTQHKPDVLDAIGVFEVEDMGASESELHLRFAAKRVVGEWFSLDTSDIASLESSFQRKLQRKAPEVPRARTDARSDSGSDSVVSQKGGLGEKIVSMPPSAHLNAKNGFVTEDSALRKLARVYLDAARPTSTKDWEYAATAAVSMDISDEEITRYVIPYVRDELSKMRGREKQFTSPENLFTRRPKLWADRMSTKTEDPWDDPVWKP